MKPLFSKPSIGLVTLVHSARKIGERPYGTL
jgi:hypothetical protein